MQGWPRPVLNDEESIKWLKEQLDSLKELCKDQPCGQECRSNKMQVC